MMAKLGLYVSIMILYVIKEINTSHWANFADWIVTCIKITPFFMQCNL